MLIKTTVPTQWDEVQEIYREAFPKSEQKPFRSFKKAVTSGRARLLIAEEEGMVLGFLLAFPYGNLVMVDYLAVSNQIRSKGTGTKLLQAVLEMFPGKRVALLIERLDDAAENREQRIARRRFYERNGFSSDGVFLEVGEGEMELMRYGGAIDAGEYLELQKYSMGRLFYWLSGTKRIP